MHYYRKHVQWCGREVSTCIVNLLYKIYYIQLEVYCDMDIDDIRDVVKMINDYMFITELSCNISDVSFFLSSKNNGIAQYFFSYQHSHLIIEFSSQENERNQTYLL